MNMKKYGYISTYNEIATIMKTEEMLSKDVDYHLGELLEMKRPVEEDLKEVERVRKEVEREGDECDKKRKEKRKRMFFRMNALVWWIILN